MKLLYWALFWWFAPFLVLVALYLKLMSKLVILAVKAFVWACQQAIRVVGKVIEKGEEKFSNYRNQRKIIHTLNP
jgi:hypothetical protein